MGEGKVAIREAWSLCLLTTHTHKHTLTYSHINNIFSLKKKKKAIYCGMLISLRCSHRIANSLFFLPSLLSPPSGKSPSLPQMHKTLTTFFSRAGDHNNLQRILEFRGINSKCGLKFLLPITKWLAILIWQEFSMKSW